MAVAVICEFNPFHNGHKYLLKEAAKRTGEPVLAVMSGSFVQRGEPAAAGKYQRAEQALRNGADLVVELPAVYSVSCAERFARCGVSIAASFGCVNYLAFGCETDDIGLLESAAEAKNNGDVGALLRSFMKDGDYYPRALQRAAAVIYGDKTAGVFSGANNILAVEYLSRIAESGIKPCAVLRKGAAHDSRTAEGKIASGSQIREMLRSGKSAEEFMPGALEKITYPENLERALLYRLRTAKGEELAALPEVSEGLENRLLAAAKSARTVGEVIDGVKTKRYTRARICRILTCALLGISEELQHTPAEYARVLGFTEKGEEMLKTCRLNVVTSAAKGMKAGGNTARLLEKDIAAADIAALAYEQPLPAGEDYTARPIKIT